MTRQITALVPSLRDGESLEKITKPLRSNRMLRHPASKL